MEPGIRLQTPYLVNNLNAYGKTSYKGDFVGWEIIVKIYD